MKTYTATKAKQHFGELMEAVNHEPIAIQKTNKDAAVMISVKMYEEFQRFEDQVFYAATRMAIKE